jgi:hypothetical protein
VREHLGPGAEHLVEQRRLAVEVGDEQLDAAPVDERVDLAHGLRVEPRPAVGQVVARDSGYRRVAQAHRGDRLGHPARLVGVELGRLAGVDLAEVTPPGALVAADQERRLAVFPTLVDVRAAGLLAHGVQALALDQTAQVRVLGAHLRGYLDPRRLALDRRLGVASLDAQQAAPLWNHGGHVAQRTPGICP